MAGQVNQYDFNVEMIFLRTLEQYGFDVDIRQAGIDFANKGCMLWYANGKALSDLEFVNSLINLPALQADLYFSPYP